MMKTVTRDDLANNLRLHYSGVLTFRMARAYVDDLINTISGMLIDGHMINFSGVGRIYPAKRGKRVVKKNLAGGDLNTFELPDAMTVRMRKRGNPSCERLNSIVYNRHMIASLSEDKEICYDGTVYDRDKQIAWHTFQMFLNTLKLVAEGETRIELRHFGCFHSSVVSCNRQDPNSGKVVHYDNQVILKFKPYDTLLAKLNAAWVK